MLEARAEALGVEFVRGAKVAGLTQDGDGVTVDVVDGETVRADYVVGCDGAHSAVRTLLGIDFVGKQYETHILLADVRLESAARRNAIRQDEFRWRDALRCRSVTACSAPSPGTGCASRRRCRSRSRSSEIRSAFERIAGEDFGMTDMRWSARFLSERRQARHYRDGRVFLAGDAAHVHSPLGGQGMNTGIGDAMNLGWKLAAAVRGTAPPWLLDSYEAERHPVGASVLKLTDAFNQLVLGRSAIRRALRAVAIRALFGFSAIAPAAGRTPQRHRHRLSA